MYDLETCYDSQGQSMNKMTPEIICPSDFDNVIN